MRLDQQRPMVTIALDSRNVSTEMQLPQRQQRAAAAAAALTHSLTHTESGAEMLSHAITACK